MNHTFYIPTKVHFGPGCLHQLAEVNLPGKKALIVTTDDPWIVELGYLEKLSALLKQAGAESVVFDGVRPNPTKAQVEAGTVVCMREKCDMVVGFGGGSSIDTAKSIAVMAVNDGDFWDYVATGSGKGRPIPHRPLPVIAIPSTAGTGTEVNPWVVITKTETKEKLGFGVEELFPAVAFVDAEVMASVPPQLTAFQGFDALFHAMEGYIATVATPVSDIFALRSMALIGESLVDAVHNGNDFAAREQVALASTLAGFVESLSNCTSNHSIAQAMGAYHDNLPHGAALLMIAKEYFRSFEQIIPQRYGEMAAALSGGKYSAPEDVVKILSALAEDCGVDGLSMSDYGITKDELPLICENALTYAGELFEIEPNPLEEKRVMEILEKSYR